MCVYLGIFAGQVLYMRIFTRNGLVCAIFLLSFFRVQAQTQDLPFEGMWKGLLSQSDKGLMYEVVLKLYYESDSTLFGTSKMVSKTGKYVEFYVEGTYNENQIQFTDMTLMKESGGTLTQPWCIKKYFSEIILEGDKWIMKGEWENPQSAAIQGKFLEEGTYCAPGKFNLTKVKGYTNQTEKDGDKIRYFQGRLVDVQKVFEVDADTITLNIIDNNQIDNDTVTIFYDKQLIVKQHRLSHESLEFPIVVTGGEEHLMVIYANNVGDIPPNTAALYFFEDGIRKEVAIRSDTSKNAGIIFKRRKTD